MRITIALGLSFTLLCGTTHAQFIAPSVLASSGGSGTDSGVTLSWTLGEPATESLSNGTYSATQGTQQANPIRIRLNIDAFLQGPYDPSSGSMGDELRSNGYIPLTEPYIAMGYLHTGGGGETTSNDVLAVTGADAIVDWVVVELRSADDATMILESHSALLQRDGDIVATDGSSSIAFHTMPGNYHIAVLHRNHLAIMTLDPIALNTTPTDLDLTSDATMTYGTNARASVAGSVPAKALWCGDVTFDGDVKYTGADNDRDPILSAIGGSIPTATITGYRPEDVNLDGEVKYTGLNNDRDPILQVIGGSVPTLVREAQIP